MSGLTSSALWKMEAAVAEYREAREAEHATADALASAEAAHSEALTRLYKAQNAWMALLKQVDDPFEQDAAETFGL